MKRLIFLILAVIFVTNLSGCSYYLNSKSATERRQDMIIAEMYNKYESKEIEFERLSIEFTEWHEDPLVIEPENENEQGKVRMGNDNSEINTMYDSYGNKTETRIFSGHPLIRLIIIRTSPNGSKTAVVYSQSGEAKKLPEEILEKVLTVNPNEIARAAEIVETPKESLIALQQNPQPPFPQHPLAQTTDNPVSAPAARTDISLNVRPGNGQENPPFEKQETAKIHPEEK